VYVKSKLERFALATAAACGRIDHIDRLIDPMRVMHHACTLAKAHASVAGRTLLFFSFSFCFF
jgi:hypothetical protein